MFDVDRVNPPGYVRDPAFMSVHSVSCCQLWLPLLSGLKRLQRFFAGPVRRSQKVRVWRFTCGFHLEWNKELLPAREVLRAHPHASQ